MLTKIEIDGFKSFEKFTLDLQPFTVIFGANATGKSNLFDALRLLSRLSHMDLATAFAASDGDREGESLRGDPIEQFRKLSNGALRTISIAVEVLLPREVNDSFGGKTKLVQTRIRYEITVERREERGRERLIVIREAAVPISKEIDGWRPGGKEAPRPFRTTFMFRSRKSPFISTEDENGHTVLHLHQEGRQGRKRSADTASATVLSSITTTEFPHLYALKEELRSIQFLHLAPEALRSPSPLMAPDLLTSDGRNLASVLARIEEETKDEAHVRGRTTDIRNALSTLVPGIRDLNVRFDETERRHRIELVTSSGLTISARIASDGTLRMLALATMINDPRCPGVVCFEEPENGVHKARLTLLVDMLREACTDPAEGGFGEDEPLRQILINTHSPVVARSLVPHKHDIVIAETLARISGGQRETYTNMRTCKTSTQRSIQLGGEQRPLSDYELEALADADAAHSA